jgi:hypothetical protein
VDLHGPVGGESGAHRVGADRVLGPAGALHQPDAFGPPQDVALALAPQDVALGVGHDHHVHRLVGDRDQGVAQQGEHGCELVAVADVAHLGAFEDQGWTAPLRVDVCGQRSPPRLGDERARRRRARVTAEHGLPDAGEFTGALLWIDGDRGCRSALGLGHRLRCTSTSRVHPQIMVGNPHLKSHWRNGQG